MVYLGQVAATRQPCRVVTHYIMIRLLLLFFLPLGLIGCSFTAETAVDEATPTITLSPGPVFNEATPTLSPTATAVATATPGAASKELIICQAAEPSSLYLYSQPSLAQQHVHHALYEPLYTQRSYEYQSVGLTKLPRLADGDASLETVTVTAGDLVVSTAGIIIPLDLGITVADANGQPITYEGSPIDVMQMVVTFELEPLVWSDGQPVTAADSVFSFDLAQSPASVITAEQRRRLVRTAVYEATGEHSLRWVGLPGWRDSHYFLNVWPPLPAHRLSRYTPAQLSQVEASVRRPLAHGPFVISEWVQGSHLRLTPNPFYYRADSVMLDSLLIRFIDNPNQVVADLLAGDCHIATHDTIDPEQILFFQEAAAAGLLRPHFQTGSGYDLLAFGVQPFGSGSVTEAAGWFADERVRQAVALCLNRERLAAELWGRITTVMPAYIHPDHPLLPADLHRWPYDVEAANLLLDEVGYLDQNGDGLRQDEAGNSLALRFFSRGEGEWPGLVSSLISENLATCGLRVTTTFLSEVELVEAGPTNPVSGRRFDLALLSQATGVEPTCGHWLSTAVTGPASTDFGGWNATNVTGWRDTLFDDACQAAQEAFWDSETYILHHRTALRRFVDQLPVLPLYSQVKVALTRPEVANFTLDPTQPSELWNIGELGLR